MSTFSASNLIDARTRSGILASSVLGKTRDPSAEATIVPFEPLQADFGYTPASISFGLWNERRQREQMILRGVIAKSVGPSSIFLPNKIDTLTATFAVRVIWQLPDNIRLPKIAPDSEGGLLMVWEGQKTILATVDRDVVHVVIDPGTLNAVHFDGLKLTGRALPPELLGALAAV